MFGRSIDLIIIFITFAVAIGFTIYYVYSIYVVDANSSYFLQDAEDTTSSLYHIPKAEMLYYDKVRKQVMQNFLKDHPEEFEEIEVQGGHVDLTGIEGEEDEEEGEEDKTTGGQKRSDDKSATSSSTTKRRTSRRNSALSTPPRPKVRIRRNLDDEEVLADCRNSWQRLVPSDQKRGLKAALLKRALANIPLYEQFQKVMPGKEQLWRKRLISQQHWQSVQTIQEDLVDEIFFIQEEAECIEEQWGKNVFGQAYQLYRHQKQREQAQQEEKDKVKAAAKEEEMKKRQDAQDKENEIKKKEKADKLAQQLIQQEERSQKKPAPTSGKKKDA